MSEPLSDDITNDPDDVATAWFGRRRSGSMTAAEAAELQAWLELDEANRAAWEAYHASEPERIRQAIIRAIEGGELMAPAPDDHA